MTGACACLLEGERQIRWLLDSVGIRAAHMHAAAVAVAGSLGAVLGGSLGAGTALLGHWVDPTPLRSLLLGLAWGSALALGVG